MTCDEAQNLINAQIDGEISAADAELLREHLASCETCRRQVQEATATHAMLENAFASHTANADLVAGRVLTKLRPNPKHRSLIPWWSLIPAMAAGFAIAWFVLRAGENKSPLAVAAMQTIGHLTVASGPVECRRPIDQAWFPLPQGANLVPGTQLRTGAGVRCEVELAHNSTLRLNENTEIALVSSRRFDLKSGRAWSLMNGPSSDPFQASAASVIFTADDSQEDFGPRAARASVRAFADPACFDLQAASKQAKLTVFRGSVSADAGENHATIDSGQQLLCPDGHLDQPKPVDDLASATSWLDEILVLKGRDNPELNHRIDDLLAQIGATKMDFLYEQEIRGLGDHCVLPLIRYIESERSAGQEFKRAEAAQIVADVATPRNIPELLGLLSDENGDVRAAAATALQRLTGQTLGRPPQKWHDDSLYLCEPSQHAWQHWWQLNHNNFPGAATQPTIIVKNPALLKKG